MSIQLNNVTFFYPDSPQELIINIEDWSVETESKHFLYGPSGCGKSTLLNLISGLHSPNTGSIKILDEELSSMTVAQRDKFRANNIGYIFQQFNLLPYLNAIDNINLASYFSNLNNSKLKQKIHQLLTELNIEQKDWNRPVSQLSIGQQQRIGIARAFINEPKLLIADEPTSSLDAASRDDFISLLSRLCKEYKSTLLFVSHDPQLKPHFDHVQALADFNRHSRSL